MAMNSHVLPTVWYSNPNPAEGETVRIFAAIQNDSGVNYKGVATFYVRGKAIGDNEFISTSGRLSVVSTSWKAEIGNNSMEVRVVAELPEGEKLSSDSSGQSVLHVNKMITGDVIKADAKKAVETVQGKGDSMAQAIVERLEELKERSFTLDPEVGPVGKAEAGSQTWGKQMTSKMLSTVYESGISAAQFAVTHWIWSLGALILLAGIWKMWKRSAPRPDDF